MTNEERDGGKWYSENYDFFSLPLFVRENTILPIGGERTKPDYDYASDVTLNVFNLSESASCTVFDTEGEQVFTLNAKRNGNTISFSFDKLAKNVKILLRNINTVSSITGASANSCKLGTLLTVDNTTVTVEL